MNSSYYHEQYGWRKLLIGFDEYDNGAFRDCKDIFNGITRPCNARIFSENQLREYVGKDPLAGAIFNALHSVPKSEGKLSL